MNNTVSAVRAALKAGLLADTELADVPVSIGNTTAEHDEWVVVGRAAGAQRPKSLGALRRDEAYTVTVEIHVWRSSDEEQVVTDRAFAIMARLEELLRGNASLGVAGVITAQVGEWAEEPLETSAGFETQLLVGVDVTTRI